MHELPLLVNISVALAYALVGGLVAKRIGLPTIVGYLLAGVALGPFTPGFHGDAGSINQLAEFGIILLMFGIGLHFSFRDLWQVRDIAVPGALLQMALATGAGYLVMRGFGATPTASLVIGLAISVASTVVLLRNLMDGGLLNTLHGKVTIGWLVLEDLATIVLLVVLPLLAPASSGDTWTTPLWAVGRALAFVILLLGVGPYLVPALVARTVRSGSRELFVLVALSAAVGTALVAGAVFGVSLALGAFLAGIIVGQTPFGYQVGADLVPFRDAFAVLFFVSVGMLVNPDYLRTHALEVLAISAVIVLGKSLLTVATGFLFKYPARTTFVVAAGRSQIGEFSFILGQTSLALGLITPDQYSLILAGSIVSITVNPLMFKLIPRAENVLRRWPRVWRALDNPRAELGPPAEGIRDHVVIVGCGRVGRHIAEALGRLQIPRLVVEADPARLDKLKELGVPVLYGDAGSSEILDHASLEDARALVITLPDDAAAAAVVVTARKLAPAVRIVARASTWDGARRLKAEGANDVVRPELEGGIEIVRRTLLDLDLPVADVQRYTEIIRREGIHESDRPSADQARVLDHLLTAARELEMDWLAIEAGSPLDGGTLGASAIRFRTGASVVAVDRAGQVTPNPGPEQAFMAGDRIALIGTSAQIAAAGALVGSSSSPAPPEADTRIG